MDAEIKAKWVAALRSGKYQQAEGMLRLDRGFCYLGVLCDISGKGEWTASGCFKYSNEIVETTLPSAMRVSFRISDSEEHELICMNDDGDPFSVIAGWIEAKLLMPDTHALPGIVQPGVPAMDRAEEITPHASRANGLTAKPTPEEITPAEAMRMAEIRLIQSEACRLGYLRDGFVSDACGFLRTAGLGELADRLEDDPWGDESGAVLAEVTGRRAR